MALGIKGTILRQIYHRSDLLRRPHPLYPAISFSVAAKLRGNGDQGLGVDNSKKKGPSITGLQRPKLLYPCRQPQPNSHPRGQGSMQAQGRGWGARVGVPGRTFFPVQLSTPRMRRCEGQREWYHVPRREGLHSKSEDQGLRGGWWREGEKGRHPQYPPPIRTQIESPLLDTETSEGKSENQKPSGRNRGVTSVASTR